MTKLLPFVIIAVIVVGVLHFFNEDSKTETSEPSIYNFNMESWEGKLYIEEMLNGNIEIGVNFEYLEDSDEVEAIEFILDSKIGTFFYQESDLSNFDGTITYSDICDFCLTSDGKSELLISYVTINWKKRGEVFQEWAHVFLQLLEGVENN